jgi:quercetin dioxygenase-like cupin family protein
MVTRNYLTEEVKENPHMVDVRKLYDKESAQIMHMTLKPGQSLKPHKTPVDVVFYILEGNATVQVGEEVKTFGPDTLVESPAFIVHCLSNEGTADTRIMVIKAPKPVAATKLL